MFLKIEFYNCLLNQFLICYTSKILKWSVFFATIQYSNVYSTDWWVNRLIYILTPYENAPSGVELEKIETIDNKNKISIKLMPRLKKDVI